MKLRTTSYDSILLLAPLAFGLVAGANTSRSTSTLPLQRPGHHIPIIVRERRNSVTTNSNWSGYAVTGARNSVSDVKGSWLVPAVHGTCGSTDQYASFWIGIDGYNSNTVEHRDRFRRQGGALSLTDVTTGKFSRRA